MEITEELKADIFSDEKQEDIFYTLLSGKTIQEEIQTSRGKFKVKFPKQKDLLLVERKVAIMRGGIPASSFDDIANFNLQKIAFLDVVVVDGENWFKKIKEKENFTWGDMPDSEFVDEVYVKAWTFRREMQKHFKRNEEKADRRNPNNESVSEALDDGLFSGVASSS